MKKTASVAFEAADLLAYENFQARKKVLSSLRRVHLGGYAYPSGAS
jgi:hypothetical protein